MIPPGPGPLSRTIDGELYVWNIATAPICTLATILRFYATRRAGRPIDREDWFALVALLMHIIYVCILTYDVAYINGRQFELIPPNEVIYIGKLTYASIPIFPVQQFFAKFSILFLYDRLFSINRTFTNCMYIVGLLQIVYSVATFFVSIFLCTPIERNWNPMVKGTCIDHNQYLAGSETINSSVDFAMVVMACFMVWHLKMKAALKWKLAILFIIGGVSGVIGFVKIGQTYRTHTPLNLEAGLWTTIQQATSCICCCAPIFGSLLPKSDWARRHFAMFSRSGRTSAGYHDGKTVDDMSTASSNDKFAMTGGGVPPIGAGQRAPPAGAMGGMDESMSPMSELDQPPPVFFASAAGGSGPPPGGPLSSHSPRESMAPAPPVMSPGSMMSPAMDHQQHQQSQSPQQNGRIGGSRPSSRPPSRCGGAPSVSAAAPWEGTGPEDPRGTAWTEIGTVPSRDSLREVRQPSRTVRVENTIEIV